MDNKMNSKLNIVNNVYFGGEVENLSSGGGDVRNGFEGCMRAIQVTGMYLPYSGSNDVGTFQHFQNVEFTGQGFMAPN